MENNKTHKVAMFHEGIKHEMVFFTGTFEECLCYVNNMIAECENDYPIEEYEILKL